MRLRHLLSAAVLVASFLPAAAQTIGEFIFQPGSTSFPESHASTIVELKDHTLMAAWFGGAREGANDVAIWGAVRSASGWSKPVELAREPNTPCWNPVLFHTKDGTLWLYYKYGKAPAEWAAARMSSNDEGKTWSTVEKLPAGLIGPVRAKPLILADGTIVAGSSIESAAGWAAWIERSTDNGKTWAKIGPITVPDSLDLPTAESKAAQALGNVAKGEGVDGADEKLYPPPSTNIGIIQPAIVDMGKKHLRLYARSHSQAARIAVADSMDNGVTWTQARYIDLPNPSSGIDAVRLSDGRIVMIYNHSYNRRSPINLAVSTDGEHFRMFKVLEQGPSQYSYPAMIVDSNGDLQITYTWRRLTIRYMKVPASEIPKE
ncbi:exo-alpha-sialidase [Terriglobus sp. 2YAB30_2]|uniref:sialidase family protein n=1 Tax=Terriglobus sp. 2YAB30_2 TaxID=3233023 RepID=UPI003F9674BE